MPTGPQHYAEGERLLDQLHPGHGLSAAACQGVATAALAHFTAALAAATALGQREIRDDEDSYSASVLSHDDYDAWWRIASEGPAAKQRRRQIEQDELAEFAQDEAGH